MRKPLTLLITVLVVAAWASGGLALVLKPINGYPSVATGRSMVPS